MTEQRRLPAILVADVVGYSKLVGSDEAGKLTKLGTTTETTFGAAQMLGGIPVINPQRTALPLASLDAGLRAAAETAGLPLF